MLRAMLLNRFVEEDTGPVPNPGPRPSVCALLCALCAALAGVWAGGVGLLVFAALCVVAAVSAHRRRPPFGSAATRRLLVVAPAAALGPTGAMAIAHLVPDRCAELAPGVFLLIWPLAVFACILGARAAVRTARLEGWPRFAAETVPALWGVVLGAVALHLLAAAAWSCGAAGWAWGVWWLLGAVAALALAQLSLAKRGGA